ncbi:MAG: glycosyltransferase-like protein, partial [Frankiales bacterium]|nr:glycosyltransferase-like protein [Frankiales bacterium]
MPARVPVTAVLVAHDGSRWLPTALSALASSTVTPARLVAVDTGSTDDSAALLQRATGHVLSLPRTTGHAEAVHAALAAVPADTRWVWLLHDDCAPDPGALSALLRAAAAEPSAAVLGPRVVDWDDPRVLVEIGCSTDGSGVRDTGLEAGELDQGQHDGVRQVLAVGTAGALVRRDVWDTVGGLDPALPLFRDDLDLGWRVNAAGHRVLVVPQARLRHARAATTGRREIACAAGSPAALDRRAGLQVLLAHTRWLPLVLLRVLLSSVLGAAGLVLVRQPRAALDELTAPLALSPAALRRARRTRAATRTVPHAALRPLMSSPLRRARTRLTGLLERGRDRAVPTLDEPAAIRGSWLRTHPGLALVLGLGALTLLAVRGLLGRGELVGGRLLAAPPGAQDLWSTYADGRDPALAVLAALATALLGKADLAVDLLLLGSLPAAGAVGFAVAGRIVRSLPLRLWAAATWALLPVATGAVVAGRLDAAAVHVVL